MAVEKIRFGQIDVTNANLLAMRPSNIDTSGVLPNVGGKILSAFEPNIKVEVERRGTIEGAAAPIIKNEDGTYAVPVVPEGGTEYQAAFTEAMYTNYANQVYFDYTKKADEFRNENPRDAEAFRAKAEGAAVGLLKTVPPDLAAKIQPVLNREILERYSAISQRKSSEDRAVLLQGLQEAERAFIEDGTERYSARDYAGGDAAFARAQETHARFRQLVGATDDASITALNTTIEMKKRVGTNIAEDRDAREQERAVVMEERNAYRAQRAQETADKAMSAATLKEILPYIIDLDDQSLMTLDGMINGSFHPDDSIVVGGRTITYDELNKLIPNLEYQRGSLLRSVNATQERRRNEAAAAAKQKEQDDLNAAVNYAMITHETPRDPKVKDLLDKHSVASFNYSDPQSRGPAYDFTVRSGYIPENQQDWLNTSARNTTLDPNATGGAYFDALNYWENLMDSAVPSANNPGELVNQGAILRAQIDPKTNDLFILGSTLRKIPGYTPSMVAAQVKILADGVASPTETQQRAMLDNYPSKRNTSLNNALGIANTSALPAHIISDYDRRFYALSQVLGTEKAISVTTQYFKQEYRKDPRFVSGIGNASYDAEMPHLAVSKFINENYGALGIDMNDIGNSVKVMRAPSSTPGDPTYIYQYVDKSGATTHSLMLRKSQIPEYKMPEHTPIQIRDAELAAARLDFAKATSVSSGAFDPMLGQTGPESRDFAAAQAEYNARLQRINDKYARMQAEERRRADLLSNPGGK